MSTHPEEAERNSPYRGLEPFNERDAAFFFGREREARLITASLYAAPLTLLYGASGVGKSSVLRAGVLPRLRERHDVIPIVFPTVANEPERTSSSVLRGWQTDPLGGIKDTAAAALYASAGDDRDLLGHFHDVVRKYQPASLYEFLAACHKFSDRRLMVILDQFEEYALYHPEDDDFGKQFPGAIVPGDLSVSFLVSLREDALSKLDRFKGRISTLWDSQRRVDHLDRAAAEDAIRLPLREYNRQRPGEAAIEIENDLVEAVLGEVQTESVQFEETGSGTLGKKPGVQGQIETPYLQLVMTRLWERDHRNKMLRLSTLRQEGGAAEIVRTHLDRVMAQFDPDEQDVAARVFHRLVTPSGAKIAFSVSDLSEYEVIEPERLAPILRRLEEGNRRILRRVATRADASDEPRYEIFHDRLGKAILSWRAKRLKEQERSKGQRDDAEQKRLAEQTRARYRQRIAEGMSHLGAQEQATWARMMFYLVSTDGRRLRQTVTDLASLSQQSREAVQPVLERLTRDGVLRQSYGSGADEQRYEVADDALASALLEWHSQYVLVQSKPEVAPGGSSAPEASPVTEFPYRLVNDLLRKGRVIPFLGAGVSLSARPQNNESLRERKPFLPSNRELKEIMARDSDFPVAEFEASDTAEVAAFYVQRLGRERLDELLQMTLGRSDYTPSATHRFLAEAARSTPLIILTTNYDTLMEQSLQEIEAPYDTVAYLPDEEGVDGKERLALVKYGSSRPQFITSSSAFSDLGEKTLVFRLHGPVFTQGRTIGSYVMTEEDQIDWLARIRTQSAALPPLVGNQLGRHHLLSLGHSARDWSQRALLRTFYERQHSGTRTSWSVALNPAPLSVITWQRYGVEVYNLDLNEWAAKMRGVAG